MGEWQCKLQVLAGARAVRVLQWWGQVLQLELLGGKGVLACASRGSRVNTSIAAKRQGSPHPSGPHAQECAQRDWLGANHRD